MPRITIVIFAALSFFLASTLLAQSPEDRQRSEFFETKIRPVLVEHCFACHSVEAEEIEGELMLDNRAAVQRGGQAGKIVTPGDPEKSSLIRAIRFADDDLQMPPDGKLSAETIRDFERWVRDGAFDPRDGKAPTSAERLEAAARKHWSFQPLQADAIPNLKSAWPRDDIDRFIAHRLHANGLTPSADASRGVWLRRVTFDLTGLPPTFEQARDFDGDKSDNAFEKVVDRLLKSPQFGERWARHWLDLARFGDTKGYDFTKTRDFPNAYKYRDWVIQAWNADTPYDKFLKYQIAADLLAAGDDRSQLAAMGYMTLGRRFIGNVHDVIDDRIDVVIRGMMGITVTCARCHDHKYDPISMKDYYALYGVFASSAEQQDKDLPLRLKEGRLHDVRVFLRGKPGSRGEVAPRRFPAFFAGDSERFGKGSGRMELAEAIASPDNPLTARVFVNRVWGHLFDQPLVATPSDFGLRTDEPVQRDVLDHLAGRFVQNNWSMKRLIRAIVLSSVYRQRSEIRAEAVGKDPENLLLWRIPRRRLDFEAMRDAMLSVSGALDRQVGGASAKIATDPEATRRTLYAYIDRQNLPDLFRTFDFANPDTHSPKRAYTTSPQQSLYLMNNAFAQLTAERLAKIGASAAANSKNESDGVRQLYRAIFARDPDENEIELGRIFVRSASAQGDTWAFGYGEWDEKARAIKFQPLPHFTGTVRQGGPKQPDKTLGYTSLHATGGHPGSPGRAVIRRWTAPADGIVSFDGKLEHPSDKGDGVRGRVVLSSKDRDKQTQGRVVGEWHVKKGQSKTSSAKIVVQAGDTVDLVVDCFGDTSFDSFHWPLTITHLAASAGNRLRTWKVADSLKSTGLNPRARYAQALLMTNEFHFLD